MRGIESSALDAPYGNFTFYIRLIKFEIFVTQLFIVYNMKHLFALIFFFLSQKSFNIRQCMICKNMIPCLMLPTSTPTTTLFDHLSKFLCLPQIKQKKTKDVF